MIETGERLWVCRDKRIPVQRTRIMGIVNVTPDSFSDGGCYFDPERAVAHGLALVAEGADIIDVGGESTRPNADIVDAAEQIRRVVPVIHALTEQCSVPISIDTADPHVAREALAAGACIINGAKCFSGNLALASVVRESGCGLVIMHTRGTPQTMMALAIYDNVVDEVEQSLKTALVFCNEQSILQKCVLIDPGIGFAKNSMQNVALLAATQRLSRIAPVLVGASRKRFIGELCHETNAKKRVGGSIGVAVWCALQGASVVRVHDVKATRQALDVVIALTETKTV